MIEVNGLIARFAHLATALAVMVTPAAGALLAAPGAVRTTEPAGAAAWRADGRHLPDPVSAGPAAVRSFLTAAGAAERRELAAEYPGVVGELDGAPATLRYEANGRAMRAAGSPYRDQAGRFLLFDPRGDGRVAQVFGDLSTADRIAVLVPGSGNRAANFWRGVGGRSYRSPAVQAADLYRAAGDGRLAVIAWLGYDTPQGMDQSEAREDLARAGAAALDRFVAGLTVIRPHATFALLGHSYGSTVIGLAARLPPQVTDLAVFGSPGMGVDDVTDLGTTARVWAGQSGQDWIRWVPGVRVFGLGHGTKPADPHFGARVFGTADVAGHDHYLSPGTDSLAHLARIAASGADEGGPAVTATAIPVETRAWTARIEAGTPAHRDRTVDALRAVATLGVVLGHWLVSAVVSAPYRPAELHGASPLAHSPLLTPVSWFLQTLGPFFFAGGYAAARGIRTRRAVPWFGSRVSRLATPVLVLAAVWLPSMLLLAATGAPGSTRHVVWSLVSHPLWFLIVYLVLTALTPVLRAAVLRWGLWPVLPLVALVAAADAVRSHGPPTALSLLTVPVAWAVPYLLGVALAEDRLPRRAGVVLLPLGVAGGAALVTLAGYPASAVGIPGADWSNLDPPSLFTLALAAAQLGVFLIVRPWLARLLRRPALWAPVAALNLAAMTVYCWHQTALLLVTFAGLPFGQLPGLLDAPTGGWPWHRALWLPVFALALAGLCRLFHRFETRPQNQKERAPWVPPSSSPTTFRPAKAGSRPSSTP